MTAESFSGCPHCSALQDALLRSEQKSFDRLREIADRCKDLQQQVVNARSQQSELSRQLQDRTDELEQIRLERDALQSIHQELLVRLRDLQSALAHS